MVPITGLGKEGTMATMGAIFAHVDLTVTDLFGALRGKRKDIHLV